MAISVSAWLLIFLMIVFVVVLCFAIGWTYRNNNASRPPALPPISPPQVWSSPIPTTDPIKSICQLYQFPGAKVEGPSGEIYVPGAPTFASNVLNGLTGEPGRIGSNCLDFDQIIAQQVQRTCIQPHGTAQDAISYCYKLNGELVPLGTTEVFYSNNDCASLPSCNGQLALISVNYQQPPPTGPTGNFCLTVVNDEGAIEALPCDPTNDNQIFRITRSNIGQDPRTVTAAQGQNGIVTQILQRSSGRCLTSILKGEIIDYNLARAGTGCSGTGTQGIELLKLDECQDGILPGFVWATIPSISYCEQPEGCSGCTGCASSSATGGCLRIANSNSCTGIACIDSSSSCTGYTPMPTPAQLSYIGNSFNDGLPYPNNTYLGLTGTNALFKWLELNTSSIFSGGGTEVGIATMSNDVETCFGRLYQVQFLNLAIYNTMSTTPVCTAVSDKNCIPL